MHIFWVVFVKHHPGGCVRFCRTSLEKSATFAAIYRVQSSGKAPLCKIHVISCLEFDKQCIFIFTVCFFSVELSLAYRSFMCWASFLGLETIFVRNSNTMICQTMEEHRWSELLAKPFHSMKFIQILGFTWFYFHQHLTKTEQNCREHPTGDLRQREELEVALTADEVKCGTIGFRGHRPSVLLESVTGNPNPKIPKSGMGLARVLTPGCTFFFWSKGFQLMQFEIAWWCGPVKALETFGPKIVTKHCKDGQKTAGHLCVEVQRQYPKDWRASKALFFNKQATRALCVQKIFWETVLAGPCI